MRGARLFYLFMLLVVAVKIQAQSSDCNTATSVCASFFSQNNSPEGTGNVFELAPGSCQTGGEFNSAWYVFTVQQPGVLNFTLTPNNLNNDYDWSLFNITDNGCAGINNGLSPEVSCNSYGENFGFQGTTGIGSSQGGFGSQNGPGNLNGPPFNGDLNVQQSQVYALVVMNYSATLDGYTLDFGQSTASIFDQVPPQIVEVEQNCAANAITVTFSEGVQTNNLNVIPLNIEINGQTFTPTSVTSANNDFSNQVTLNFSAPLPAGDASVVPSASGTLEDICGNVWTVPFAAPIAAPLSINNIITNPACNGEDGSIVVDGISGGLIPYSISLNNVPQASATIAGLSPGTYNLVVTDINGCTANSTVVLADQQLSVTLGDDLVLCDMQTTLTAVAGQGSFQWNPLSGVSFSSSSQLQTSVSATVPGQYQITASVTLDDCIATDVMLVTFNFPPLVNLSTTGVTCNDDCDGEIRVESINGEALTATVEGEQQTGSLLIFDNVCGGNYAVQVAFNAECQASYPVTVEEPAEVVAQFSADNFLVSLSNPNVILTNTSMNADSISWVIVGYESEYSWTGDEWTLSLPPAIGAYQIKLIAHADSVCFDEALATIVVQDDFRFYLPNAFTPNNDGINDYFFPVFSTEPEQFELIIFDRWGNAVFRTSDSSKPWTGDVAAGDYFAQDNIYNWLLKIRGTEIETLTYNGMVSLVR